MLFKQHYLKSGKLNGTARLLNLNDYRGRHRKGVATYNATSINLQQKTLVSLSKNVLWTLKRGWNKRKCINWHYFCRENVLLMTFSELPSIGLC
jgi:hypothetical protein